MRVLDRIIPFIVVFEVGARLLKGHCRGTGVIAMPRKIFPLGNTREFFIVCEIHDRNRKQSWNRQGLLMELN